MFKRSGKICQFDKIQVILLCQFQCKTLIVGKIERRVGRSLAMLDRTQTGEKMLIIELVLILSFNWKWPNYWRELLFFLLVPRFVKYRSKTLDSFFKKCMHTCCADKLMTSHKSFKFFYCRCSILSVAKPWGGGRMALNDWVFFNSF